MTFILNHLSSPVKFACPKLFKIVGTALLLLSLGNEASAQVHRRGTGTSAAKGKPGAKTTKKKSLISAVTLDIGIGYHSVQSKTVEVEVNTSGGKVTEPFTVSSYIIGTYVYPKYHFMNRDMLSLSVGIPLTIGMSEKNEPIDLSSSSHFGSSMPYTIGFSLPLMLDLNFGSAALNSDHDENVKFGGFVGVGFGILSSGSNVSGNGDRYYHQVGENTLNKQIWSAGPVVHAGIRTKFGILPLGIKLSYMPALGSAHSVVGFALYVPI